MPRKKGTVTLAEVVRELGALGEGKKMSPKRFVGRKIPDKRHRKMKEFSNQIVRDLLATIGLA